MNKEQKLEEEFWNKIKVLQQLNKADMKLYLLHNLKITSSTKLYFAFVFEFSFIA